MQALRVFAVSTLAFTLAGWLPAASADSAEATCEVRKDGDKKKEASGPCSFSQRQGYINIDLRNGKTISAMRTLVQACAGLDARRAQLELVED